MGDFSEVDLTPPHRTRFVPIFNRRGQNPHLNNGPLAVTNYLPTPYAVARLGPQGVLSRTQPIASLGTKLTPMATLKLPAPAGSGGW
ncbi:hypothetical protein Pla123a_31060 [Posidoniimonas polymericola]|uniref:Uncharacterized protein n=1 Tax=Posidoniimonas polymericola TaxID=2528002 RepID=A0A5C5YL46_9BACT|nr:hypothetical protein Pla123a_31060 [Posidoniimonas polymericola]